jgi:acetyltransferase-like isoleucine patch superfamily enzyme
MSSFTGLIQKFKEKTKNKSVLGMMAVGINGIVRIIQTKIYLRKCNKIGKLVSVNQKPLIVNRGYLELGDEVRIWSSINRTKLFVEEGGQLIIGKNSRINGVHISASQSVTIGQNVRIAPYVIIIDDDYHDVQDHFAEAGGKKAPIVIEDNVWIAMDAKILKGVTIGQGSVVATSAVVTKDVPPYSVVAGVPAKVIKQIPH